MADTKISAATAAGTLVGTEMIPLEKSGDTTAYRTTVSAVGPTWVNVKSYGTDTAAFASAVAALPSGGGVIFIPRGTYAAHLDLSGLGQTKRVMVQGEGRYASVLTATTSTIINCQGTNGVVIKNLHVDCNGNEIGILQCRNTAGSAGAGGYLEDVLVTGSPTVAGIFNVCYENTTYRDVTVALGRASVAVSAPCLLISGYNGYGDDATDYVPAGGAMWESSQAINRFYGCTFTKDDNSYPLVTGSCIHIGDVNGLYFHGTYIHAPGGSPGVEFITQGRTAQRYFVSFEGLHYECNYPATTEGSTAFYARQTGSAGTQSCNYFILKNIAFANKRGATHTGPYYSIDFYNSATDFMDLYYPDIQNVFNSWGGGIRGRYTSGGEIHWNATTITATAALSATDTTFTRASGTNDSIRIGDLILFKKDVRYDGDTTGATGYDYCTVSDRVGDLVTFTPALAYDHPASTPIYINPSPNFVASWATDFYGIYTPTVTYPYSYRYHKQQATDSNVRDYYGPHIGFSTAKQSPVPIFRPFGDEPGSSEAGMLVAVTDHNDWAITDLNGIGMTNFLAYRLNTLWYAFPMMHEGSATYNPDEIAVGGSLTTTVTCAGAALGDFALASCSITNAGMTITANVTNTDTVSVTYANLTAAALNLASHTLYVMILKR